MNYPDRKRQSPMDRFWRYVNVAGADDCWLWTGVDMGKGYGGFQISLQGKQRFITNAHRFSWELHNAREIPAHLYVMHTCDTRRCVNPAHLALGTQKENLRDMTAKGRRGLPPTALLDHAKAAVIRDRLASGESMSAIAASFGVSKSAVNNVKRGRSWREA